MVAVSQIAHILLPWTGTELLKSLYPECESIAKTLSASEKQDAKQVLDHITVLLFSRVRALTKGTMVVHPDGGYPVRMQTEDFAVIADDLLFFLFDAYPADEAHLQKLTVFAMENASLSALRALYTRFAHMHSREELQTIAQIARGSYPPYRLRGWLD